jgi:murein DD-endopeptidase MepM/ murein hydrolase activator NlpD
LFQRRNKKDLSGFLWSVVLLSGFQLSAWAQDVTIDPERPRQGQTVKVLLAQPASLAGDAHLVQFNGARHKMYPVGKPGPAGAAQEKKEDSPGASTGAGEVYYRTLLGVPADLSPGLHELYVDGALRKITVLPAHFATQKISLPSEKDNFIASPGELEAVQAARETATNRQLWRGLFAPPCCARIISSFGLKRVVNGKPLSDYFHSGLDYAAPSGTPVRAAGRGRVLLTHRGWRLHGNIVCIDHGQGVVSFYIHLSKILVKPGQLVGAGDMIGRVGATGRASGPHLHFSLYINDVATNPTDWYRKVF